MSRSILPRLTSVLSLGVVLGVFYLLFGGVAARSEANALQGAIELTPAERQYLADHSPLCFAVDPAWLPFEGIENGRHVGISADYLALFKARIGAPFELRPTETWQDSIDLVESGQCDLLPMLNRTPERETFLSFTSPYMRTPQVIVTRTDNDVPYLDGYAGLNGKVLAVTKGFLPEEMAASSYPDIKLKYVESQRHGLHAVSQGKAFAVIGSLLTMNDYIRRDGLVNVKIAGVTHHYDELRIGIRKDQPLLRDILQKAVNSVSPEDANGIFQKWTAIQYVKHVNNDKVFELALYGGGIIAVFAFYAWQITRRNRIIEQKNRELTIAHEAAEAVARQDDQTRLPNRRAFYEQAAQALKQPSRYTEGLSLVLMDLDNLKQLNDTFGHTVGDKVLKETAALLQRMARTCDTVARFSGDEFIFLLPQTDLSKAEPFANSLRDSIARHPVAGRDRVHHATASFGVSAVRDDESDIDLAIARADQMLAQAKKAGGNRVEVEQAEPTAAIEI